MSMFDKGNHACFDCKHCRNVVTINDADSPWDAFPYLGYMPGFDVCELHYTIHRSIDNKRIKFKFYTDIWHLNPHDDCDDWKECSTMEWIGSILTIR
jgi:hypothetical protein